MLTSRAFLDVEESSFDLTRLDVSSVYLVLVRTDRSFHQVIAALLCNLPPGRCASVGYDCKADVCRMNGL